MLLIGPTQSLKIDQTKDAAEQLTVTGLMTAAEGFWGESEYTSDRNSVPLFDPKKDFAAPLTLAASVEKGASRDPNVKLETARMVVFGNGDFVSVEGLQASPVGLDLATNAFNWLLNRDSLIAIAPKAKQNIQISLSEGQMFKMAKWVTLYIPLIVGLFGLYYLWARNGKSILKLTVTVASTFVFGWLLWRVLLGYLGTAEGRQISRDSLIFVGAIAAIGILAFILQKTMRGKPQTQQG